MFFSRNISSITVLKICDTKYYYILVKLSLENTREKCLQVTNRQNNCTYLLSCRHELLLEFSNALCHLVVHRLQHHPAYLRCNDVGSVIPTCGVSEWM